MFLRTLLPPFSGVKWMVLECKSPAANRKWEGTKYWWEDQSLLIGYELGWMFMFTLYMTWKVKAVFWVVTPCSDMVGYPEDHSLNVWLCCTFTICRIHIGKFILHAAYLHWTHQLCSYCQMFKDLHRISTLNNLINQTYLRTHRGTNFVRCQI
jgi:hypothetical protein